MNSPPPFTARHQQSAMVTPARASAARQRALWRAALLRLFRFLFLFYARRAEDKAEMHVSHAMRMSAPGDSSFPENTYVVFHIAEANIRVDAEMAHSRSATQRAAMTDAEAAHSGVIPSRHAQRYSVSTLPHSRAASTS